MAGTKKPGAMPVGMVICLTFAVVVAATGLYMGGTGSLLLIGVACFLAICGRIAQAGRYHQELLYVLRAEGQPGNTPPL